MGRLRDYAEDNPITGGEKLIGTDLSTGTMNFVIDEIGDYFATAGILDDTGSTFIYVTNSTNTAFADGAIHFVSTSDTWSSVTAIEINRITTSGFAVTTIINQLEGSRVKVGGLVGSKNNYAIFTIDSIDDTNLDYIILNLSNPQVQGDLIPVGSVAVFPIPLPLSDVQVDGTSGEVNTTTVDRVVTVSLDSSITAVTNDAALKSSNNTYTGENTFPNINVSGNITHTGDTNTQIDFLTNDIRLSSGGVTGLSNTQFLLDINPNNSDLDFKIGKSGSGDAVLLDAGTDTLTVNSPATFTDTTGITTNGISNTDGSIQFRPSNAIGNDTLTFQNTETSPTISSTISGFLRDSNTTTSIFYQVLPVGHNLITGDEVSLEVNGNTYLTKMTIITAFANGGVSDAFGAGGFFISDNGTAASGRDIMYVLTDSELNGLPADIQAVSTTLSPGFGGFSTDYIYNAGSVNVTRAPVTILTSTSTILDSDVDFTGSNEYTGVNVFSDTTGVTTNTITDTYGNDIFTVRPQSGSYVSRLNAEGSMSINASSISMNDPTTFSDTAVFTDTGIDGSIKAHRIAGVDTDSNAAVHFINTTTPFDTQTLTMQSGLSQIRLTDGENGAGISINLGSQDVNLFMGGLNFETALSYDFSANTLSTDAILTGFAGEETGTWAPVFTNAGAQTNINASYSRAGKNVIAYCSVSLAAGTSGNLGLDATSLPFAPVGHGAASTGIDFGTFLFSVLGVFTSGFASGGKTSVGFLTTANVLLTGDDLPGVMQFTLTYTTT